MKPRVLITRGPERAAALVQALQEYGFEASVVPVTRTVHLQNEKGLPDVQDFSWVAFTSATAVEAFANAMDDVEWDFPRSTKLAAVGPATAQVVGRRIRKPELVQQQATGVELAESLLKEEQGRTDWSVLWPCAQSSLPDFPDRLRAEGVKVEPWECYTTEAVPAEELKTELHEVAPWDAAVFAAPSAVSAFASAWDGGWDFASVAIGQTTARALRDAGSTYVYVSLGTGTAELLNAVVAAVEGKALPAPTLPATLENPENHDTVVRA